jgi:hypothetical protein
MNIISYLAVLQDKNNNLNPSFKHKNWKLFFRPVIYDFHLIITIKMIVFLYKINPLDRPVEAAFSLRYK